MSEAAVNFVILSHRHTGAAVLADQLRQHAAATTLGPILSAAPEVRQRAVGAVRTGYRLGEDGAAYLDRILSPQAGTADGTTIGFELYYDEARADAAIATAWDYLMQRRDLRIIHVARANALDHMLATAIAERTPGWIDPLDRANPYRPLPFSLTGDQCRFEFDRLVTAQCWVRQAFAHHAMLEIEHGAQLCTDLSSTISRACRFIGADQLGLETAPPAPRFRKLPKAARQIINFAELQNYFCCGPYQALFGPVSHRRRLAQNALSPVA